VRRRIFPWFFSQVTVTPMSVRAIKAGAMEFLTKPCRGRDAGVVLHSLQAVIDCGFRRLNLAAKFLGTMFYEHFLVSQLPVVQFSVRHRNPLNATSPRCELVRATVVPKPTQSWTETRPQFTETDPVSRARELSRRIAVRRRISRVSGCRQLQRSLTLHPRNRRTGGAREKPFGRAFTRHHNNIYRING
jgi:hypothetical protein